MTYLRMKNLSIFIKVKHDIIAHRNDDLAIEHEHSFNSYRDTNYKRIILTYNFLHLRDPSYSAIFLIPMIGGWKYICILMVIINEKSVPFSVLDIQVFLHAWLLLHRGILCNLLHQFPRSIVNGVPVYLIFCPYSSMISYNISIPSLKLWIIFRF